MTAEKKPMWSGREKVFTVQVTLKFYFFQKHFNKEILTFVTDKTYYLVNQVSLSPLFYRSAKSKFTFL